MSRFDLWQEAYRKAVRVGLTRSAARISADLKVGRAPSGRALASRAPAGLDPSDFDPSRKEVA